LGIVLPLVVTLVIGGVAESLHGNGGLIQVREVSTTNANYWVIYLGITMYTVVATYAQASSMRGSGGELDSVLHPRPVPSIIARWLVLSVAAAIGSFFSVLMVMVALVALYPQVYGSVSASSVEGVRFLWATPLYAVAACGIGVGIGALVAVPAAAITVITVWSLLIENAVVFAPSRG
jgi:putative membrane protein